MKKKANSDSVTDDDGKGFMVNVINEHTSVMSEEIDVPIICLDEDDDDDDDDYKLFLDHITVDNNLGFLLESNARELDRPLRYEADSGKSETRKFETFSGDSKRSKLEIPRDIRETIQRDNRVAERRKKRNAELEAARDVALGRNQESIRRDNKVRKLSEVKAETLGVAPLVRTEEEIQRDNSVSDGRKKKTDELKAETLRKSVSLDRTEDDIQRDNRIAEVKAVSEASKVVPVELKSVNETSEVVPMELKSVNETSKVVPVELKSVNETSKISQATQRNKEGIAGRRKKNREESVAVMDKDYMSYLTWLVDSLKDSTTKPMDTLKESTLVPDKELLAKVKVELDLESWSDDSDIIAVSDSPFSDGEVTPFVASKSVIVDLEKESKENESSCWFRKQLMDDLIRPYNETEFLRLYREASIHRRMTRSRELRMGRESDYETDQLGLSYLERFNDFGEVYKRVDHNDKARALKLLRGFFFYLKNVSHDGAFKPWMDPRLLQEMFY